jgi:putative ABC transport system permease protein
MKNLNLGFDKDLIVTFNIKDNDLSSNYEPLKNELLKHPAISDVSVSTDLPSTVSSMRNYYFDRQNKADKLEIIFTHVDHNFIDLYGMELIKGRKFTEESTTDQAQALIINETAAKKLGWEEPIGKRDIFDFDDTEYTIIGVIKDFHFKPLHHEIEPLFITTNQSWVRYFSIKISPENIPKTLDFVEKKYKEFSPKYPFNFSFLDESIDAKYKSEQKLGQIINYFTLLALLIACLGLLGLASFSTKQRSKEIGIRKVVGASTRKIFTLLSQDFIKWILIANMIAWPIAYLAMNRWLQNFAYRIDIEIWMFLLSALLALAIAIITISYTAIRAAQANPSESLRYE